MNTMRTGLLMAALTGLFLAVGYLIGREQGMIIAFLLAAGMNLFAYWNSDKMVLRMYGARQVDRNDGAGILRHGRASWRSAPGCRCPRSTSSTIRSPTPSPPGAIRRTRRLPPPPACSSCLTPRRGRRRDGA